MAGALVIVGMIGFIKPPQVGLWSSHFIAFYGGKSQDLNFGIKFLLYSSTGFSLVRLPLIS